MRDVKKREKIRGDEREWMREKLGEKKLNIQKIRERK